MSTKTDMNIKFDDLKAPPAFEKNLLQGDKTADFLRIGLRLADPSTMRAWSYGEVTKAETINYRTFRPEYGGLFCAEIFGPMKDYECLCGKYKGQRYRGKQCDKCKVDITVERVRRERMGHIELAYPVAHILFYKSLPSRMGMVLDLSVRDIERVLYFEVYIVIDEKRVDDEEVARGKLLDDDALARLKRTYGANAFEVGSGAEGLREYMRRWMRVGKRHDETEAPIDKEIDALESEIEGESDKKSALSKTRMQKLTRRLRILKQFRAAGIEPKWMILDVLPVLPPNLRPLVVLDGGRFTSSDLNDLYRRVINRNERLKKLIKLNAPGIIVNHEKRMLQEAVDSLLDNGRRGKPMVANNKRPLKSLADSVKGKTGRFRQNLLGKRVDFSARSVIVVGPELKLHQCGIPKHMALTLFKPFVINMLAREGMVSHPKQARLKVEEPDADVWDALGMVIHQHPVLLNRAPTLHRLGIQAFEPVLVEGKAIQLHPLPCVAFNADFDGDQMAVHVPLTLEAQAEARVLMLSANNILAPANGEPIMLPSQDIVLGIYYTTRERLGARGEGMKFWHPSEAALALNAKAVELQAKVEVLLPKSRIDGDPDGSADKELVTTTVGRLLMLDFLPAKIPFAEVNRVLKKKDLAKLVAKIFHRAGLRETVMFCDQLMQFGFRWSTRSGISICMNDMVIPDDKARIIDAAARDMQETQEQYDSGLVTADEKYNKSVDLWDKASEDVTRRMMETLSREVVLDATTGEAVIDEATGAAKTQESFNSLYMMADSGARGSQTQIKQLAGMRGLMTKPDGRIMETAITANFREGLNVLQYFLSTHGARKGLSDTALKTANSGYMTRRLVDVAQDVIISSEDCGTDKGISVRAVLMGGEEVVSLRDRILGRTLARDVANPMSKEQVLFAAGTLVDEDAAEQISSAGVDEVMVRSPVLCDNMRGICIKCYGRDLGRGHPVRMGEAIGVVAAQSIGEPGTQLTMRTFHIGGAASRAAMVQSTEAKTDGTLRISNARCVTNSAKQDVVVSRGGEMSVIDGEGRERERYHLQYGELLKFADGDAVRVGEQLSTRDPHIRPIITEYAGAVQVDGVEEGINAERLADEETGAEYLLITADTRSAAASTSRKKETKEKKKKAVEGVHVKILDDSGAAVKIPGTDSDVIMAMPVGASLKVQSGGAVGAGDVIATTPQEASKSRDITGGLPRVAELFEAREPKEASILAGASGRIKLMPSRRAKQVVAIVKEDGSEHVHDDIPRGRTILLQDGAEVKEGDEIVEGDASPHEILEKRGVESLTAHIVSEVQSVYRLQGVTINDKHIEVIVRQMLRCVRVTDPGDSPYLKEDQALLSVVKESNREVAKRGGAPIIYKHMLMGITKAALATDSFISAASFQETTRVLTDASVSGRRDTLRGLKENVIVGRLIPAGTGFAHYSQARAESEEAELIMQAGLSAADDADSAAGAAGALSGDLSGGGDRRLAQLEGGGKPARTIADLANSEKASPPADAPDA